MTYLGFAKQALEVTGDTSIAAYTDDSYVGSETPAPCRLRGEVAKKRIHLGGRANPTKRVPLGGAMEHMEGRHRPGALS